MLQICFAIMLIYSMQSKLVRYNLCNTYYILFERGHSTAAAEPNVEMIAKNTSLAD